MDNVKVKQMLVSVIVKDRKAYSLGEETELFCAKSVKAMNKEYADEINFFDLLEGEEAVELKGSHWRYWWTPCVGEYQGKRKGRPVYNKDGTLNQYLESLPLICSVFGGKDDVIQICSGV